jgi:hypothetical protein
LFIAAKGWIDREYITINNTYNNRNAKQNTLTKVKIKQQKLQEEGMTILLVTVKGINKE